MNRSRIAACLALHATLVWAGFALRIDQFPLSWAPMYSTQAKTAPAAEALRVMQVDKQWLRDRGWELESRDGSREWVAIDRVNVPMRSMWRLYYERTFGKKPPKYSQQYKGGPVLEDWMRESAPGLRFDPPDFARRLFESLNKTLGRSPDDPDFIVTIRAERWWTELDPEDLASEARSKETVELRFRDEWRADWL